MRFDRGRVVALLSLVAGLSSCKDLVMPAREGGADAALRSRIAIVEIVDGVEKLFVEPVDVVIYDDAHPLSSGGLKTSAISTRGYAEFDAIAPGVYSVAMIHPRSFSGVQTLPNQFFDDVSLPGDVTLRTHIPSIAGRVLLPAELMGIDSIQRILRFHWEEPDPRSTRVVTLRYSALVAADGSFVANLPEGLYPAYFELSTSDVSMHRHVPEPVSLDPALEASVDLQLEKFSFDIAFEHPEFPADAGLSLAMVEAAFGWGHSLAWSEGFARGELPVDAWLGRELYRLDLSSADRVFFDRLLWWDTREPPSQISLPVHKVEVVVLQADGSPASTHGVRVRLGELQLSHGTDLDGRVRVFLERGVYQVEVDGLEPQNLSVDGDVELQLELPGNS